MPVARCDQALHAGSAVHFDRHFHTVGLASIAQADIRRQAGRLCRQSQQVHGDRAAVVRRVCDEPLSTYTRSFDLRRAPRRRTAAIGRRSPNPARKTAGPVVLSGPRGALQPAAGHATTRWLPGTSISAEIVVPVCVVVVGPLCVRASCQVSVVSTAMVWRVDVVFSIRGCRQRAQS